MPRNAKPSLARDEVLDANGTQKQKSARTTTHSRVSLDHLLGFSLPPRQQPQQTGPRRSAAARTKQSNALCSRERFVHAQYRFVLHPAHDFTAHYCDPDIPFHWPHVLQVIVASSPSHSSSSDPLAEQEEQANFCPICLSEPSAPRMTKCGHIFCYPCLLHLFELSEASKWTKCPVCADTINRKDLKSVHFIEAAPSASLSDPFVDAAEGDYIDMRLIERPQITTLALPRSATWPSEAVPHLATPWHFSPDAFTFARFMLATPEYLTQALTRDMAQLDAMAVGMSPSDIETSFVVGARRKIEEQLAKADALRTPALLAAKKQSTRAIAEAVDRARKRSALLSVKQPEASTSSGSGASSSEEFEELPDNMRSSAIHPTYHRLPPAPPNITINNKGRKNLNPPPIDATYHFYQAASGANIFLHPLDIKALKSHFGLYSSFPDTIRVRVEGKEEGSMNEDLKRRCRYLGHLPASADVTFLEVDLEPIVGSKSLEPYSGALKMRRNKRRDRAKRDDRAKFKSEEKERERNLIGADPYSRPRELTRTASRDSSGRGAISQYRPTADLDIDDDFPASLSPPSPSFMPSSLPPVERTIWGTRAVPASAPFESEEPLPKASEGWDSAWVEWETRVATEQSLPSEDSAAASNLTTPTNSRKAKKAKKVTISLSGSGARGAR